MSSPDVPRPDVVRELQASRLIYPFYRKLIERFELEMFPCKDLEEHAADTSEALTRVRLWFAEADRHIEATHMRQVLQEESMDEPMLRFLIWRHVAKEGKTDSDRFKVDFLLGNYLAQNMPADLARGEVRVSAVASVLEPVLGESEYLTYVEDLEECVRELRDCHHLEDLLERNILVRARTLKAGAGETFFHQAGLIAFTRFNFLTRRRVVDLMNTDLDEMSGFISELQRRKVASVNCTLAKLGESESIAALHEQIKQWRKPYQGKYGDMEALQQVSNLRKALKSALAQEHKDEAASVASAPKAREVPAEPKAHAASAEPEPLAPLQATSLPAIGPATTLTSTKLASAPDKPATPAAAKLEVAKVARVPEKPPPPDLRPKQSVASKQIARKVSQPVAPRRSGFPTLLQRISRWYQDLAVGFKPAKPSRMPSVPASKPTTAVAIEKPATPAPVAVPRAEKPAAPAEKPAAPAKPGLATAAPSAPVAVPAPAKTTPPSGRIVQPSARVPEAIKRISQQIASLPPESNGAVSVGDTSLSLSAREMSAFRKPNENLSGIFQRSAAVRLLLSEALGKAESDRASLAPMLKFAYSETTLLQDRITQTKNNKDVEGSLALTACAKALSALCEKIEESLTQHASVPSA